LGAAFGLFTRTVSDYARPDREGRNHLLLGGMIETGCPVRILQGVMDEDVPWQHAVDLSARLRDDVVLTCQGRRSPAVPPAGYQRMIAAVAEFDGGLALA
jgi:hypothetical protein